MSADWFEDPAVLEAEVQNALRGRSRAVEIPGYEAAREVARGGQGIVYRAVQAATRRIVAIKILAEHGRAADRRRFEREVDLAASLRHPGIVGVYDGGTLPDGRPYLVMEFVEGRPIDEHVQAERATPLAIAALMAQVADAVAAAHRRGIIHRDLKPANIRVDATGVPRILDFGLAKGAEAGQPEVSQAGQFLGSLPWASPEQVRGDPASIDTRSDIYSLGVVLFQLLAGRLPYDTSGPLSSVVRAIAQTPAPALAALRGDVPEDLAIVVARCLAKEPERRYQSASELALDLQRTVAGEPIQARRDSAWYTVTRAARRYRLAAIASLVVLGVIVVAFGASWAWRERALRQGALAATIDSFMVEALRAVDPDRAGRDVKVTEVLDTAAERVDAEFAAFPAQAAAVHDLLSDLYMGLGEYEPALREADRALAIRAAQHGADDASTLDAEAGRWAIVHKLGRTAEAAPELERIAATASARLGPAHPATLSARAEHAQCLLALGDAAGAAGVYEDVLARRAALRGEANTDAISAVRERLAAAYASLQRFDEAEAIYRDLLAQRTARFGEEHSETVLVRTNLAVLLVQVGKIAEALPLEERGLEIQTRKLGPEHPDTLTAMNNLGTHLHQAKRPDEALPLLEGAFRSRSGILGPDHPHTLVSGTNLAALYTELKRYDEAETLLRDLLDRRERLLGPESLDVLITCNNLAGLLQDSGRAGEAEPYYRRADEVSARTLGADHWIHAVFASNHGKCLTALERFDEAEARLLAAHPVLAEKLGPAHPHALKARANLAGLYGAWGKPERAAEYAGP